MVLRQTIEKYLVDLAVDELLAAGWLLKTEECAQFHNDAEGLKANLGHTDEDVLRCDKGAGKQAMVLFVYGNDGYDVVCDNSVILEEDLAKVTRHADLISEDKFELTIKVKE